MENIDLERQIKHYLVEDISEFAFNHLRNLYIDFGAQFEEIELKNICNRLCYFIHRDYKGFILGDIRYIFDEITSGKFDIKKLSVSSILRCFQIEYHKRIEKNKVEYEKREMKIAAENKEKYKALSWYGTAIRFRIQQREKGNHSFDDMELSELAKKLKSGELKVDPPRNHEKRNII